MKKRILSFFTLLCMVVTLLPTNVVFAATSGSCGTNGNNVTWNLDSSGTLTISGTGNMNSYNRFSSPPWDYSLSSINTVVIEEGVTNIGSYAFNGCINLKSITIPDGVTSIGSYAFYNCVNLKNVFITNLTAWYNITFWDWNANPICYGGNLYINESLITNITIPDNMSTIKDYTFYGCGSLKNVTIGNNITKIGKGAFGKCRGLTNITIPDGVTSISADTFNSCSGLTSITIPDGVTSIGKGAFSWCSGLTKVYWNAKNVDDFYYDDNVFTWSGVEEVIFGDHVEKIPYYAFNDCSNLKNVYYNGTVEQWNAISIGSYNSYLTSANRIYFAYLILIDENGRELSIIKQTLNSCVDTSGFEEKTEQVLHFYTNKECTNEFNLQTPITENSTLYLKYVTNRYTYKFLDDDGKVLKEETVDFGTNIVPPENPSKQNTKQYTYTFDKWSGYTEGMTVTGNVTFTAQYTGTVNKYTYKFLDNDDKVLKEVTVDYGTVITPPAVPADKDPYTFDYWNGYTVGMTLSDDVEFKAVYKYKDYKITAEGLENPTVVTYNSSFNIESQKIDDYHYFIGYFTETDGKGMQITNDKGESLKAYDVVGDLTVYPYFYSGYMNKVELQGVATAMPGDTIKQNAIFATDKEAMYLIATVKYPEYLNFKSISGSDFAEASKDSETLKDGYKYLDITCLYDYNDGNMPINQNIIPFEITFEVATNAPIENANISIEDVTLIGNDEYLITDLINNIVEIKPKLAENISITGNNSIDKTTKYTATVSPDYTTNKAVTWSVDNEEIATISQDGTLTPHKNGNVKVTATANDGSGKYDTKTVNVTAYATITSLEFNGIAVEIVPDKYDYMVYVKNDTTKISLKPTYSGGTLKLNGSGIWRSGQTKEIDLTDKGTTVTLNRNNVPDMTDNAYTITIVKFEGTKTTVSDNGKSFVVKPINIASGNTVILALYNGDTFVEMQSATYNGEDIPFTTSESYTKAKVMVWSNLTDIMPICDVEIIE